MVPSRRILITDHLPDLVEPALALHVGTILDGESVAYRDGRISLGAMQSRALASPRRAALLDGVSPTIEPVPATQDPETALGWWQATTFEGLMLKRQQGRYRGGGPATG